MFLGFYLFFNKSLDFELQIHVPNVTNKQSIRLITKTLIEATLDRTKGEYTTNAPVLDRCIEILKCYVGSEDKQDLQLETLYAIQLLSNEKEHPSGK